jgi:hypothetical protein
MAKSYREAIVWISMAVNDAVEAGANWERVVRLGCFVGTARADRREKAGGKQHSNKAYCDHPILHVEPQF